MSTRRLLMLGGADIQVTAIQEAKALGYHVITCDNRPGNPCHRYADEYNEVSTTDLEGVLSLAKHLHIDGISAYASLVIHSMPFRRFSTRSSSANFSITLEWPLRDRSVPLPVQ